MRQLQKCYVLLRNSFTVLWTFFNVIVVVVIVILDVNIIVVVIGNTGYMFSNFLFLLPHVLVVIEFRKHAKHEYILYDTHHHCRLWITAASKKSLCVVDSQHDELELKFCVEI